MATGTATYIGGSKSASPWREIRIVVTETGTNVSNNTSTLSYEVWLDNGNTNFSYVKIGCKVIIDNVTILDRAYSSSEQYSAGRNESVRIASGTTTVTHGSDGKKTIATGTIKATCSSAGIVVSQTATSNFAFVCTDIARASSVSISTNTTVLGQARTITITKSDSTYRHKLYYKFSTQSSYTAITSSYITGTTQSFTPPASLSSLVPSGSASATGTIKCETFTSSGTTAIGESTCSFTGTIPATTPTLSGGTWIGDALTISLSGRASANLTHTLTYKFATQTSATTIVQTTDSQSYSWTPTSAQKTAMVQAVATDNASGSGTITCTTYNGSKSIGSTTKTWTGKIPASTASVASAAVTMGGSKTFSVSSSGSNLTHTITYEFYQGSTKKASGTVGSGITTSKSWTVPTSLAAYLSNASSGTIKTKITTYNGTVVCGSAQTISSDFTANAPASTVTLSATSVAMGTGSLKLTLNRATTNMTHVIEQKYTSDATSAYASLSSSAGDSFTWNSSNGLDYTLAQKIPSATSGTWNIRVTTKIGTATVGTAVVKNVTLTVPNNSSTQPTLSTPSYAPSPNNVAPSGNSNFAGMYIVGMSKVSVTVTPTTKQSATIPSSGLVLSVGGATAASGTATSGSQKTLTASKAISSAGSLTAYVKVTDSRGYVKQSSNTTITAYAYSEPAVVPKTGASKVVCGRSTQSGTLSSSGTYLHIEAGKSFTSLNSKNSATLTYALYKGTSSTATATGTLSSETFTSSSEVVNDLTSTYKVVLTATDTFGNSNTYTVNIPTDSITMGFRAGGTGIGIGMYSQGASRLDVAWESVFTNTIRTDRITSVKRILDGTAVRSQIIPVEHLSYTDLGFSDAPTAQVFYEAWLKKICVDYPSQTYGIFIGSVTATGARQTVITQIYDTANVTDGLPQHSLGIVIPYSSTTAQTAFYKFGTSSYAYYFHTVYHDDVYEAPLTYVTNSLVTEEQFANIRLFRSGRICTLHWNFTPNTAAQGSSSVQVGTIPSGYRPMTGVYTNSMVNTTAYYLAQVGAYSGGALMVYKNHTGTAAYRGTLTWITA